MPVSSKSAPAFRNKLFAFALINASTCKRNCSPCIIDGRRMKRSSARWLGSKNPVIWVARDRGIRSTAAFWARAQRLTAVLLVLLVTRRGWRDSPPSISCKSERVQISARDCTPRLKKPDSLDLARSKNYFTMCHTRPSQVAICLSLLHYLDTPTTLIENGFERLLLCLLNFLFIIVVYRPVYSSVHVGLHKQRDNMTVPEEFIKIFQQKWPGLLTYFQTVKSPSLWCTLHGKKRLAAIAKN